MEHSTPNPDEMRMFGFDPDNEADVVAFRATDPTDSAEHVTDYSRDAFEFGDLRGQVAADTPTEK